MKITPHPVAVVSPEPSPAHARSTAASHLVNTGRTAPINPFASMVTGQVTQPVTTGKTGVRAVTPASQTTASSSAAASEYVNPFASWVTCAPTTAPAASSAGGTVAETAPVNPLSSLAPTPAATQATASGPDTATTATPDTSAAGNATPAQPGIAAYISAIMDGSFQPTYKTPAQLAENTPFGTIYNSPAYYASDETAQQLASLLGGTVVQKMPFASSNALTTEIKANFIQLPSGQTVNAADLAYYARCGNVGVQQLAADLTSEINTGGAITRYNDQMIAYMSGQGPFPTAQTLAAGQIGPAIAGMTYPPGTLAADGSVINPNAPQIGT